MYFSEVKLAFIESAKKEDSCVETNLYHSDDMNQAEDLKRPRPELTNKSHGIDRFSK